MMSNRTQVLGIFSRLIIYILGIFSFIYVFRVLNVKNAIIGYFYTEPDVVKISDFEYDFKSLLWTNSGANENEYYVKANAKPVSNFDKTKKYTVTINGIQANRVYGDYTYINANFTNNFISTQDTTLLTDSLNIKINFYTEETIIVFTTQSGEQAVRLWSSYIAKNGFVLKIVEDNYTPQIEVENNLTNYTANLYYEDKLIETMSFNAIIHNLPTQLGSCNVKCWKDKDGKIITNANLPLSDIDLYAELSGVKLNFNSSSINSVELSPLDLSTVKWRYFVYGKPINITFDYEYNFLKQFKEDETKFDMSIKMNNFYGNSYTLSSCGENHNSFGFTYTYYSNEQKCDRYLNLVISMSIKEVTEDYFIPKLAIICSDETLFKYQISKNEDELNEIISNIKQDLDSGKISFSLECNIFQLSD